MLEMDYKHLKEKTAMNFLTAKAIHFFQVEQALHKGQPLAQLSRFADW